jgi:hypothetical protein
MADVWEAARAQRANGGAADPDYEGARGDDAHNEAVADDAWREAVRLERVFVFVGPETVAQDEVVQRVLESVVLQHTMSDEVGLLFCSAELRPWH